MKYRTSYLDANISGDLQDNLLKLEGYFDKTFKTIIPKFGTFFESQELSYNVHNVMSNFFYNLIIFEMDL